MKKAKANARVLTNLHYLRGVHKKRSSMLSFCRVDDVAQSVGVDRIIDATSERLSIDELRLRICAEVERYLPSLGIREAIPSVDE